MRVFQFITPSRIGGAEMHVLALCRHLGARGHDVTAICPHGRPFTERLRAEGIKLWSPRTWGKGDVPTVLRLALRLRRERVEVLHTHLSTASLIGSLAGRCAGVPAVATVHGLNRSTCFTRAHRIIAVSDAVRRHLAAQGVPASRMRLIYDGVDIQRYPNAPAPQALRARLGVGPDDALIGAVGRLAPEKGQTHLLAAAAILIQREHLPVRVLLVGEGRERAALEQAARQAGIAQRVIFAGFQRDAVPYQAASDILCVPSLKEGLSLSAIEAMALGKPVVGARTGGIPEVVVPGETGLLVEPGDPEALAAALARLVREPLTAHRMGEAGRQRAAQVFSLDRMVEEIEEVYREVAARPA